MRKIFSLMLLSASILLNFSLPPSFADEGVLAPLSPAFLEWQKHFLSNTSNSDSNTHADTDTTQSSLILYNKSLPEYSGHIPVPVDLSHLANNPPIENYSGLESLHVFNNGASPSDSTYDLRTHSLVTGIKNQSPYETCWAFAAIAAMESNFLRQGGTALDLSEMHLAYYTFNNSTKSKAFCNLNGNFSAAMNNGGNSFFPTALYSRLDGPVTESELPYSTSAPSASTPETYTQTLRLKDVYYLPRSSNPVTVNQSDAQRTVIKQRILDNGAVVANYYHDDDDYNNSANGTAYYNKTTGSSNHAVTLIGWDDNFSRNNFKTDPGINGAWLVKNSWGTNWESSSGYFWMSYANYLTEGSAYIVEQVNPDLKAYYYDALGWCSSWGYSTQNMYAANAFKATRDGEKLIEVGLYTPDNNMSYEIYVYINQGTSMPNSPIVGTHAKTLYGTISHAGYHTIALDSPVSLTKNQYFSVIVKYIGQNMIPIESKVLGFSDNFTCESGSFFSQNGTTWSSGNDKNATIKAFTTSSNGDTVPVIRTMSLPSGMPNTAYSATLSAYGKTPITWTVSSGNLPDGLTLDSSTGIISGTPTSKKTYTFTVTATNDLGTASKQITLEITDVSGIATTSITGYVGYNMNETLQLASSTSAVWAVDELPQKLTLDANTGVISGKPSKAGEYTLNVTATTSTGVATATVKLTINEKPTKASISTSKLTQITLGSTVTDKLVYKGTEPVTIAFPDGLPDGLTFDSSTAAFSGTPTKAGNFVIKATASNIVNTLTGKEPAVKKIKLVVKAQAPVIKEIDSFPDGIVGKEYTPYQVELSSGTSPDTWSASGLPKGLEINTSGEITGTPEKAGSFKVKITGKNNGGKYSTGKIPMNIYAVPEITTKSLKNATTGKAYSVKMSAKGDPTSWDIRGLPEGLEQSLDKKGNVVIAGVPETMGISTVVVSASNVAGEDTQTYSLTVKGVAPKIKASVPKGTVGSAYTGTITVTGSKPLSIDYEILTADQLKHGIESLDELGLTFSADSSTGIVTITGTPKYSVKGLPLQVTATNPMKSITKKVSLKISGTKPSFTAPSTDSITAAAGSSISMDFVASGSGKMTLYMKSASGFTFTQTGANTGHLSGTVPSGKNVKLTVTAKNADGKATKKLQIQVQSGNGSIADTGALPEDEYTADTEDDTPKLHEETAESKSEAVIFGEARDSGSLTQSERDVLEREGYVVAAVLPEVSVTKSGIYDLETEIYEDIPEGAVMLWLAFPEDSEGSEDDEIAEFCDEDGQEITGVPESHKVKVSVWLREGVTYRPIIAVKH